MIVTINMDKAKDIWRDKIRADRKPMLKKLDLEFMRAVEAGDTAKQQEIASEKQRLRNTTAHPDIESAKTVDELKAVDPLGS